MGVRILVVDDEPAINNVIVKGLTHEHADWEVFTENNSEAALKRLLNGEHWDVILLDIIMPRLNGMALFTELRKKKPELCACVVFITGAVLDPAVRIFQDTVANQFIEKPFTLDELEAAVNEMVGTQK